MAVLWGFASHGGSILSREWLATVEAPGYPRHPPSTKRGSWLTAFAHSVNGYVLYFREGLMLIM